MWVEAQRHSAVTLMCQVSQRPDNHLHLRAEVSTCNGVSHGAVAAVFGRDGAPHDGRAALNPVPWQAASGIFKGSERLGLLYRASKSVFEQVRHPHLWQVSPHGTQAGCFSPKVSSYPDTWWVAVCTSRFSSASVNCTPLLLMFAHIDSAQVDVSHEAAHLTQPARLQARAGPCKGGVEWPELDEIVVRGVTGTVDTCAVGMRMLGTGGEQEPWTDSTLSAERVCPSVREPCFVCDPMWAF